MMRGLRLLLWFLVGVGLSAVANFSYAFVGPTISSPYTNECDQYSPLPFLFNYPLDPTRQWVIAVNGQPPPGAAFAGGCGSTGRALYVYPINTCPVGYTFQNNNCVAAQTCPPAGTKISGIVNGVGPLPSSMCVAGCTLTVTSGSSGRGSGGQTFQATGLVATGASCTGTPNAVTTNDAPPLPCALGTCPGTVNGVSVCLPCGSSTNKATGSTTTVAKDGTQTSTANTTTQTVNNNNTITTTTTTTTTVTPPGGPPTTTTETKEKTEDQRTFCEENPTLSICRDSSFGGTCGAFACSGDAIQCAMAREQHQRNCRMFDDVTTESTLGEQMQAGNDPLKSQFPTDPSQRVTKDMSTMILATRSLSTQCPGDLNLTISGQAVSVPFSNLCTPMTWVGYIVVALAMVGAIRYVVEGL